MDAVRALGVTDPLLDEGLSELVRVVEAAREHSPGLLVADLRIARGLVPMTARERRAYEKSLSDGALDGRFELYKTTAEHEGDVGRAQHGFPSQEEVAG